jgi:L-ascorbate metabolism protein UlaG (beta-lactamase superfamily)
MKVLFVGQSTFRLALRDGPTLLTDPWFKLNPLLRAVPPWRGPEALGRIDYLLGSHNHLDHLDRPSLALAKAQGATVIGSARVARRARRFGVRETVALAPGEERDFGAFSVLATPAFHPLASDAVGFIVRAEARRVYFCGDTRPDPVLVEFLRRHGPIDLAFLQIACARYFGRDDGLNLATAARLARAFGPAIVIPMHLHGRCKEADPHRLATALAGSRIAVRVMERGEEVEFFDS